MCKQSFRSCLLLLFALLFAYCQKPQEPTGEVAASLHLSYGYTETLWTTTVQQGTFDM